MMIGYSFCPLCPSPLVLGGFIVAFVTIACEWGVLGGDVTRVHCPWQVPSARDLPRFAKCRSCGTENVAQLCFCYHCGVPPTSTIVASSTPLGAGPGLVIDVPSLTARRAFVTTAMAGRAGQIRKDKMAGDFDLFLRTLTSGQRGWESATPDDVFDWLCYLDTQGNGTKLVHDRSCPGVGTSDETACAPGGACGKRYAAASLQKGFVSKLRMAYKESLFRGDVWDPRSANGNPCGSPRVDAYLTYAMETQKQVGVPVNQAAPLLSDTLEKLLESMQLRLLLASDAEAISIARDIALFALAFHTMRRGFDISNTLGSHILRLPDSAGLIVNFQFGKTLRVSAKEAVVVMADVDSPTTCAFRAVTKYIDAAYRVGWDLAGGHMFPQVSPDGERGQRPMTPKQMTAALQAHFRSAGLEDHYTMHSFRVGGSLSRSLAGTAVDEIMKLGGWKTEEMASHYIGPTTSGASAESGKHTDELYASVSSWVTSSEFQDEYAACGRRFNPRRK